jgi:hypothetical protein
MDVFPNIRHPLFQSVQTASWVSFYRFALPRHPFGCHVAVLWDGDRDERALLALVAIRIQCPHTFQHIRAIAETRGEVTLYCDALLREPQDAQVKFQHAITSALAPHDRWVVKPLELVKCSELPHRRICNLMLPDDHPLRAIPERFLPRLETVRS